LLALLLIQKVFVQDQLIEMNGQGRKMWGCLKLGAKNFATGVNFPIIELVKERRFIPLKTM